MSTKNISSLLVPFANKDTLPINGTQFIQNSNQSFDQSNQSHPQLNSESDQDLQTKPECELKKKKKHKKKKKNSVPLQTLPNPCQNTQQLPKNSQNQVSKQTKVQPQVVRHNIYQIKRSLFSENTSANPLKNLKEPDFKKIEVQKQNFKDQNVNETQIKAITSMFGQFFRIQNLKSYQQKAQITKQKNQEPTRRIIKTIKPINSVLEIPHKYEESKINQTNSNGSSQILTTKTIYPTSKQVQIPSSRIGDFGRFSNSKQVSEASFSLSNNENINQQVSDNSSKQSNFSEKQIVYIEPQFKYLDSQKLQDLNRQLTDSPLVEDNCQQINFDEQNPISPQSFEQFMNNNEFNHPLLQCQSKGSFSVGKNKYCSNQRQINIKKQENNQKNFCINVNPTKTLNNLAPNLQNVYSSQTYSQDQMAITPFFQRKQRDTQFDHQLQNGSDLNTSNENNSKQLQKTYSHSGNIYQKKTQQMQTSRISANDAPKQSDNLSNQKKLTLLSHIYPKRINSFLPIEDQMNHIDKMFKDFNRQNVMMIDVLSYNSGFETLEQVSSGLVNQMDKQQQDSYVYDIINKHQNEWKIKLLGDKLFNKQRQLNNLSTNKKQINYQINQPKPTKTCSPFKYTFNEYGIDTESNTIIINQEQQWSLMNKSPLRLPTFSHNNFTSHAQFDNQINQDNSSIKESNAEPTQKVYNNQKNKYYQSKQQTYKAQSIRLQIYQSEKTNNENQINPSQQTVPIYQNLHQLKQKNKPTAFIQKQIQNIQTPHIQQQSSKFFNSYENLQNLVMTFRKDNCLDVHTNFKEQAVSINGSLQHSIHDMTHQGSRCIQHSLICNERQSVQKDNATEDKKHFSQKFTFPINKIQPINITSKSKSRNKHNNNQSSTMKNQKSGQTQKIKIVSSSTIQQTVKPIQIKQIINPPQMNKFWLNSSHVGSFMLNNAVNNYIVTHPTKQTQNPQSVNQKTKISKRESSNHKQIHQQSSTKKKVSIKKQTSSSKKLSINQKSFTSNGQKLDFYSAKNQTDSRLVFHKLNPQLQEVISRINYKPQSQLQKLIKSRISQKSNSKYSSRQQSPVYNKLKVDSIQVENSSLMSNYQIDSGTLKQSKNLNDKKYQTQRQQVSIERSRNSSKSGKKSGLQLWNEGLSQLKSSRRSNGSKSPKIFLQKNQRQNEKIIGITRWNENLSKFKTSRSKSGERDLSNNKSASKQNNVKNMFGKNGQRVQKGNEVRLNVQIKKHKYQVQNVQRRYL